MSFMHDNIYFTLNSSLFTDLLNHCCGTAFRLTYDSLTLPFISSAGR